MKTFSTSGTGSGQTLSPIETDKIPIYDSKEDVEADLANLTAGQIVATKDTGDELSHPVNVVEEGNLHAVSSNAVAVNCPRFPDYANQITELTGNSWIATQDVFILYTYSTTATSPSVALKIDGVTVSVQDTGSSTTAVFCGYAKKGQTISLQAGTFADTARIKLFPLI